ncbi:MAG: hypothetical protein J4G03_06390 [Gemmatimonadetes bacterium]|nr:hypothetical protein [Gemmatimonadota bacterium]
MSNRGESHLGTMLGVVAVVALAGFMYWMYGRTKNIEADRAAEAAAAIEAERVLEVGDLLADPLGSVGREVQIDSIAIGTRLGEGAFTIALTPEVGYPVAMAPDPIQLLRMTETNLYGGDQVYVRGRVYVFTDSIARNWVEEGIIDEAMLEMVPSSVSFLFADSVTVR